MIGTLQQVGNSRIDYFHLAFCSQPNAYAVYVCGEAAAPNHAYSKSAKYRLQASLCYAAQYLSLAALAAVFIDVNDPQNLARPAYQQMKSDLQNRLFHRVFVFHAPDLLSGPAALCDLCELYQQSDGFELLVFRDANSPPLLIDLWSVNARQPRPSINLISVLPHWLYQRKRKHDRNAVIFE